MNDAALADVVFPQVKAVARAAVANGTLRQEEAAAQLEDEAAAGTPKNGAGPAAPEVRAVMPQPNPDWKE